ncbi:MAG: 5-formyltetrahydrofolate cyclo-ligase [Spirochaetaceae bacterium]|nr:5-formyltetrahydrofolate cyclo-ligase [Spirochaetaceae bacterium]
MDTMTALPLRPDKTAARRLARAAVASIPEAAAAAESAAAARRFLELPEFAAADCLLAFLSMRGEIDTLPLVRAALAAGKTVAAPRIEGADLAFVPLGGDWETWPRDAYGIPEPPAGARALTLGELGRRRVIVAAPGLAFDRAGGRLGRGKGFYDRFLRAAREAARKGGGGLVACGFCLAAQIAAATPCGPEDEGVDLVVTGAETIRIR